MTGAGPAPAAAPVCTRRRRWGRARAASQPNMQAPEDHRGALRVERQAHKPHKVHDTRPARPPRRGFCKPSLPLDLLGPRPAAACCRCLPCGLPASQLWLSCESAAADQGRAVFPFFFITLPISDLDRVSLRDATRWQGSLSRPTTCSHCISGVSYHSLSTASRAYRPYIYTHYRGLLHFLGPDTAPSYPNVSRGGQSLS